MGQYYLYFIIYIIVIWLVSVLITINDKKKAKEGKWRVPEAKLFLFAFLGGAFPMYITMKKIRHKTNHKRFMIGLPAIIILHIALIALYIYFFYIRKGL